MFECESAWADREMGDFLGGVRGGVRGVHCYVEGAAAGDWWVGPRVQCPGGGGEDWRDGEGFGGSVLGGKGNRTLGYARSWA